MCYFDLPATNSTQAIKFVSAKACSKWLDENKLTNHKLTNVEETHASLLREIKSFNRYSLKADERLAILDLLREPTDFVQGELAREYAWRPLPLDEYVQSIFNASQELWQELATGYLHCLQACLNGHAFSDPSLAAMIAQRALASLGAAQVDAYRAGLPRGAAHWQAMHRIFAVTQKLDALFARLAVDGVSLYQIISSKGTGIALRPVEDKLRLASAATSVQATYVEALLLDAAHAEELGPKSLALVQRWTQQWAEEVIVLAQPPAAAKALPLCVDLDGDQPAVFQPDFVVPAHPRWLELTELKSSIKQRLAALEHGKSPVALGLGEDCVLPAGALLLKRIYRLWSENGSRVPSTSGDTTCQLIAGQEAIHNHLSGETFRQPVLKQSAGQANGTTAFGVDENASQQQGITVEQWQARFEPSDAASLWLEQPYVEHGARLGRAQLLALRLGDAPRFQLGVLRWVVANPDRTLLRAQATIYPGAPEPVALRRTGADTAHEKFHPGFLLPEVPSLNQPVCVITPSDWYRHGRILEIFIGEANFICLTHLIEVGSDFQRCAFELAEAPPFIHKTS